MSNDIPSLRAEGFPGQRLVIVPRTIVVKMSRQPITRDLCVTHIGSFTAASGHSIERPRGTSQHILLACISGKGHATLQGSKWQIKAGHLLFLPPREAHSYGADPLSPWTILWVHFRGERVGDYLSMLGVSIDQPLVRVNDTSPLEGAFEDAFHHVTYGFGQASMIGLSTGFARMLGVMRVLQETASRQPVKTESRLLKALAVIRESPAQPWTVEDMAHEANLSTARLTELCRRQTGMPPLAYLIRLRLQLAMHLLQQGQHNVEEAARAVGYEDPFYFSRLFRKHIGISPSACRQGP